jgi:ribosomal-protein-alanine N-acetyltransferase
LNDLTLGTFDHDDMDQILAIEKASFPDPYPRIVFTWFKLRVGEEFIVARKDGRVVGYLISEVRRGRGHIASMAVAPDYRRMGIGEAMARKSIDRFAGRVKQAYLEVRPSNDAAIHLYHKLSFEETSKVRKKYYPDGEDAIEMTRAV